MWSFDEPNTSRWTVSGILQIYYRPAYLSNHETWTIRKSLLTWCMCCTIMNQKKTHSSKLFLYRGLELLYSMGFGITCYFLFVYDFRLVLTSRFTFCKEPYCGCVLPCVTALEKLMGAQPLPVSASLYVYRCFGIYTWLVDKRYRIGFFNGFPCIVGIARGNVWFSCCNNLYSDKIDVYLMAYLMCVWGAWFTWFNPLFCVELGFHLDQWLGYTICFSQVQLDLLKYSRKHPEFLTTVYLSLCVLLGFASFRGVYYRSVNWVKICAWEEKLLWSNHLQIIRGYFV